MCGLRTSEGDQSHVEGDADDDSVVVFRAPDLWLTAIYGDSVRDLTSRKVYDKQCGLYCHGFSDAVKLHAFYCDIICLSPLLI